MWVLVCVFSNWFKFNAFALNSFANIPFVLYETIFSGRIFLLIRLYERDFTHKFQCHLSQSGDVRIKEFIFIPRLTPVVTG